MPALIQVSTAAAPLNVGSLTFPIFKGALAPEVVLKLPFRSYAYSKFISFSFLFSTQVGESGYHDIESIHIL